MEELDLLKSELGLTKLSDQIMKDNYVAILKQTLTQLEEEENDLSVGTLSFEQKPGQANETYIKFQTYTLALQYALNQYLGKTLVLDGDYGDNTKAAVIELQTKLTIKVDGEAGKATLKALLDNISTVKETEVKETEVKDIEKEREIEKIIIEKELQIRDFSKLKE